MAAIGHGLLGLGMSGWVPARLRNDRLRWVWPGVLVMLAYAVDLTEWLAVVVHPGLLDQRFATHSPLLVGGLAVGACLLFGLIGRFRRPWPYLVIAGVVLSHYLLDLPRVRVAVAEWYFGRVFDARGPGHAEAIAAELCLYGAPLIWTLLLRASFERGCSPAARLLARVLVVLSVAAVALRHPAAWGPVYLLSVGHAGLLLRRHVHPRLLWNVLPLLPLLGLGFTSWLTWHRIDQGIHLATQERHEAAIRCYQQALAVRSRTGRGTAYMRMGLSLEKLGRLEAAERAFDRSVALAGTPGWAEAISAGFYVRHTGTPYFRPQEARRRLEHVLRSSRAARDERAFARHRLEQYRRRGLIP